MKSLKAAKELLRELAAGSGDPYELYRRLYHLWRKHSPVRELQPIRSEKFLIRRDPAPRCVEYRTALKLSPNRRNGLLSAGKAAEQAQHSEEAIEYYKAAAQQTDSGKHSQREDPARAVKATLVASGSGDRPAIPARSDNSRNQSPWFSN